MARAVRRKNQVELAQRARDIAAAQKVLAASTMPRKKITTLWQSLDHEMDRLIGDMSMSGDFDDRGV